jgi:glycine betaine/choline ABC-type transport system substrate-binding protein
MKKWLIPVLGVVFLFFASQAMACVGKTLIIGATSSPNDKLLAQMMAVIINERTGTTVNVNYFEDHEKLFAAVKKREVNIFVDNTGRALQILGKSSSSGTAESVYSSVKDEFKSQFHLVMLKPFGGKLSAQSQDTFVDVPVIAEGILIEYPALPRVINKLAKVTGGKNYEKLLSAVESGDKPNQVAKDYLKKKRVI